MVKHKYNDNVWSLAWKAAGYMPLVRGGGGVSILFQRGALGGERMKSIYIMFKVVM